MSTYRAWAIAAPPGPPDRAEPTDSLREAREQQAAFAETYRHSPILVSGIEKWNGPPLSDWYDLDGDEEED